MRAWMNMYTDSGTNVDISIVVYMCMYMPICVYVTSYICI